MKARALKANIQRVARWFAMFYAQNSFRIFLWYGLMGFVVSIYVNRLGGFPTYILPLLWSFMLFGFVVLFDVLGLIVQPKVLANPSRLNEYDPTPFSEGGRKQGFMWGTTVVFLLTTELPLTVFILPIIVGIVLAVFDEWEELYYDHWFWGSVITGVAMTISNAIMLGYWGIFL